MKRFKFVFSIILFSISFLLLGLGFYFYGIYNSHRVMLKFIDNITIPIDDNIDYLLSYNSLGNSSIDSSIDISLESDHYPNLNKFSDVTTNLVFKHDKDNKKAYLEINSKYLNEDFLNYKYLIDNSTLYYKVLSVDDKYINNGGYNYFEMYNDGNSFNSQISYLYEKVISSLKKSIKEEYITEKEVNYDLKNVREITLRIDNNNFNDILNDILNNLKKDKKSNEILNSFYGDFSKCKIKKNKKYLADGEYYELKLYTTKLLSDVVKIDLIHSIGDDNYLYSYTGDLDMGRLSFYKNDVLHNYVYLKYSTKKISVDVKDNEKKLIASFNLDKGNNGFNINYSYSNNNLVYDVIYSSLYTQNSKLKTVSNNKTLSFKFLDNGINLLSGYIKINSNISNKVSIKEDLSNSRLYSTLSDSEKVVYKDYLLNTILNFINM